MAAMWSLGGLSLRELLKRTARETWEDDVFGQAARLAFYHFLAIFPVLLLTLIPLARISEGEQVRNSLTSSVRQFLPAQAALLFKDVMHDLDANARAGGTLLVVSVLGALWAGINAAWAMIVGLNTAYETEEDRGWREVATTAATLAFAVVALVFAALLVTHYFGNLVGGPATLGVLARIAQWAAIIAILLISFALFYRFGPNLKDREWRWSTPGAVFAAVLWIAATLLFRVYFEGFAAYHQIYGRLASTAVLILWLYVTSATVLIGAELNSEIEKASEQGGAENPARGSRRARHEKS